MSNVIKLESSNGCSDTPGFLASGVHCDIREKADGRLDLALVVSETPCAVAGVFTRNRLAAAPVGLCRNVLAEGTLVRGFVANSGNANACTGAQGVQDAMGMQSMAAARIGCQAEEVFVCSTGRIGKVLPMERISNGISRAAEELGSDPEHGQRAADAILTSDTRRKVCTFEITTPGGIIHLSGMAKGAGMIEPNMATMLAFLCTDAAVSQSDLQDLLVESVSGTFNAITVDGDESTNDTVLLFANGGSGIRLAPGLPGWEEFRDAMNQACQDLAGKIVGDGEKISKVVELCIEGAASEGDAKLAARAVANSLLVKSSWYGNDPNWGRIMDALGYSGAELEEETVQMWYLESDANEPVPVFSKGMVHHANQAAWKEIVSGPRFGILINLGQGGASCRLWSTDLTEGYVNFNKSE